ncbi:unnamed protein product [Phytophthora lilii]|uniref:Unnamed protein product n=1 Tax=Phytophthora lilii TaxID=2077276 RepID=A0A9W6U427_9STRA|nr:unnamed protein product [Phytophthora lilii]
MSLQKVGVEACQGFSMELRFKHVSLAADLAVVPTKDEQAKDPRDELPTLPNQVVKQLASAVAKKFSVRKHILRDVTGSFRPGTVTLLLGQSGAGKSALMKLLSGRFPMGKEITLEGEMLYNDVSREKLRKRLPQFVNYVTQYDTHMPTMTVRETLAFAYECCTSRDQSSRSSIEKALDAATSGNQKTPSEVLQMFGLDNCQNTIMGNHMVRGTSGGEKKRTTTGEMEFGTKFVTLMDEITTGLDSAAAFDIIAAQRDMARRQNKTVVISLLQPSPEIFGLFDDVLLLSEGRTLYHGPTSEVQNYFEMLGLICPPQRDLADFLCDLSTPQQIQFEKGKPDLKEFTLQGRTTRPRSASEFADIWVRSPLYEKQEDEAETRITQENSLEITLYMDEVPEFQQGFLASTWTLMKRQVVLTRRNTAFLLGRAGLVFIVGLLFGSLFFNMNMVKAQITMGIIFAAVLFLGLGQSALLIIYFDARAVFYKQRAANFYRTISYVLATSLVQIPIAIMETLVFGSLTYWMSGFVADVPSFFVFELILLLTIMVFSGVFFFLSAAMPNLHIAEPVAMVALLFFVLFAGFIVSKDQIPDGLMFLYWSDPVSWAVRSIAVSQYRSYEYDICVYDGMDYCLAFNKTLGEYSLGLFDVPADTKWVNYGLIFLAVTYTVTMILSYFALEYHRYERPEHIALPKNEDAEDDGFQLLESPPSNSQLSLLNIDQQQVKDTNVEVSVEGVSRYERVPPVTVAFKDLWYTVSVPGRKGQPSQNVDLLKGITGYAMPGSLTALMGSTGAGKTTLMDVIAGRKTSGTIKGEILLNGFAATDLSVRRCTGYCEQTDVHSTASTFREALTFSAFLRQGSNVPDSEKHDTVSECLELLALEDIADHIIRGSSMEKMKRLTIGVEMAAQPSVLFLDEPTSGLDARSAKVIMDGVRRVADSGRTVLCTIHQPSSDVFFLFDSLLLLKRGGETVYFGDLGREGSSIIKYFEAIPSVPRIKDDYNPATWMLEVIGAGVADVGDKQPTEDVDFVQVFNASASKKLLDEKLTKTGVFLPSETIQSLQYGKKRAASNGTQIRFLLRRFFRMFWRTPAYNLTRLAISPMLGLIFGIVYIDVDYTVYQGINSGLGMVFLSTVFIGIVALISGLPMVFEERTSFYRERAAQTYNALWYFVGFTIVELPYVVVCTALFTAVFYPMVGFVGFADAVFYGFNIGLMILFQAYLGQLLVFAFPTLEVGSILGMLINAVSFMLMGFNPPADDIPHGYQWLHDLAPDRYSFGALAGTVFGYCSDAQLAEIQMAGATSPGGVASLDLSSYPLGCQLVKNAPPSVGQIPLKTYIDHVFNVQYDHIMDYVGIFVAMIVVSRVCALLCMRYLNHQKR